MLKKSRYSTVTCNGWRDLLLCCMCNVLCYRRRRRPGASAFSSSSSAFACCTRGTLTAAAGSTRQLLDCSQQQPFGIGAPPCSSVHITDISALLPTLHLFCMISVCYHASPYTGGSAAGPERGTKEWRGERESRESHVFNALVTQPSHLMMCLPACTKARQAQSCLS